mmetsp:Transcript_33605/g.107315  ORF Transcript_33605/g.107315 Transcript_33605/m.107315 type:complete len:204 (+) Transcript_33605:232-843(+)
MLAVVSTLRQRRRSERRGGSGRRRNPKRCLCSRLGGAGVPSRRRGERPEQYPSAAHHESRRPSEHTLLLGGPCPRGPRPSPTSVPGSEASLRRSRHRPRRGYDGFGPPESRPCGGSRSDCRGGRPACGAHLRGEAAPREGNVRHGSSLQWSSGRGQGDLGARSRISGARLRRDSCAYQSCQEGDGLLLPFCLKKDHIIHVVNY